MHYQYIIQPDTHQLPRQEIKPQKD